MKKLLPFFLFLLIANALFFITNIPVFYPLFVTPKDRICTLVHGATVDYYLYVSSIRESMDGATSITGLYTSEDTKKSMLYLFFIIIGKIASVVHLDPFITYHISRILSVELFFVSLYFLVSVFLTPWWALLAAVTGLFSTAPPWEFIYKLGLEVPPWWADTFDPLSRADVLPHHAFGLFLLLFTLGKLFLVVFDQKREKDRKDILLLCIGSFATGLIFPPAGLLLGAGIPLSLLLFIILNRKKKGSKRSIFIICLTTVSVVLSLLFMKSQTLLGFPWSQWSTWDVAMWNNNAPHFARNFLVGSSVLIPFAIPALLFGLKRGSFKETFLVVWILLPIVLMPFTDFLGIGKIRLAYMASYIPLGIFTVYTLRYLVRQGERLIIKCIAASIILLLFLLFMYVSFQNNIKRFDFSSEVSFNACIPRETVDALRFLNRNAQPYAAVVLSDFAVGNMLPAFARMKSYFGHWTQTMNFQQKEYLTNRFFRGQMDDNEVTRFLHEGNISYVYWGVAEQKYGGDIKKYKLPLDLVFQNASVQIYKIR